MLPRNPYPPGFEEYQEDNLNDPLANVEQFNIIQFLSSENEFQPPLDDSALNIDMGQQIQDVQDPHHGAGALYQLAAGLPDSPPITDISGNGSSASPSSNSEPPYSPDSFSNYSGKDVKGLGARGMNDGGLMLGVNDLNSILQNNSRAPQRNNQQNKFAQQNNYCYMSPFPQNTQPAPQSAAPQMPSPDSNTKNENFIISQFPQGQMTNLYNALSASSDGSINSQGSEVPIKRKRPRMDAKAEQSKLMYAALGANASSSPETFADENYGQHVIKFNKFQEDQWNSLYDEMGNQLSSLQVHVVADKGFNYSANDNCFVNQKKNHFQISVHVEACDSMPPRKVMCNGALYPIRDFKLVFAGVKAEMPTSEITIRQSRADRKPHTHLPVQFEINARRVTKVTVPRLHFSETTLNNQRKNFRPNPEQKYFLLVIRLFATISDESSVLIQSYASEKVIVRATNPGSFEPPETDATWNKVGNALQTNDSVVIGADRSIGKLTVDGDIYTTGRVICPSDIRLKEEITEKAAREALDNLCKLRVVDYLYKPEVAEKWGLTEEQRKRTGVIAQELAAVLPDAVRDIGDYLTVNESRVFYETVLATQELCRLTGDLDQKIDEKVAEISQRLTRYAQRKKMLSSLASNLNSADSDAKSMISASRYSLSTVSSKKENRRSRRQREEDVGCSSKIAQGTVMTLVGVMAICLVAMCSLYVLDWHHRNYGFRAPHIYQQSTPSNKEGPANLLITPGPNMPIFQPDAPPIFPKCVSPSCPKFSCMSPDEEDGLEDVCTKVINETIDKSKYIARTDYPGIDFGTGVNISIPMLGMTIGPQYCIEKSCNKRRGIFNLFVPISHYFPPQALEIDFRTPSSKMVNTCGPIPDFVHKPCAISEDDMNQYTMAPQSHQIFDSTFELFVGTFVQTAYRFRVGYNYDTCLYEEQNGGSFEEYNLIFYRVCSTQVM